MSGLLSVISSSSLTLPMGYLDPKLQDRASEKLERVRSDLMRDSDAFEEFDCLTTDRVLEIINGYLGPDEGQETEASSRFVFGNDHLAILEGFKCKVLPFKEIAEPQIKEALIKTLDRLEREYSEEFRAFLETISRLDSLCFYSKEKILKYFTNEINRGYCAGMANALFDKILRKESSTMLESLPLVQIDEIFYGQILHWMTSCFKAQYEKIDNEAVLKVINTSPNLAKLVMESSDFLELQKRFPQKSLDEMLKQVSIEKFIDIIKKIKSNEINDIKQRMIECFRRCISHLNRNSHIETFLKSERFSIKSPPIDYQRVLERTMLQFPKSHTFVGIIQLPLHIFSFQYGPEGYFLYDTFNVEKGFFAYSSRKMFFQQLRYHALYDVRRFHFDNVKKNKPAENSIQIGKEAEELLMKEMPFFSIRPIQDINPHYKTVI